MNLKAKKFLIPKLMLILLFFYTVLVPFIIISADTSAFVSTADKSDSIYDRHLYLSDTKYTIGPIDQVILERYVQENGLQKVQTEIQDHTFFRKIPQDLTKFPRVYELQPNPYRISEIICHPSSYSPVYRSSYTLFQRVHFLGEWHYTSSTIMVHIAKPHEGLTYFSQNKLNSEIFLANDTFRIDYCTHITIMDNTSLAKTKKVYSCTKFYHKESLLAALNNMHM